MGTAAALTAAHAGADAPLHAIYRGCAPADGFDDLGAGDFLALADDLVVLFGNGFSVGVKAGVRLRTQKFRRPSGQQQSQLAGCGEPRRFDADEAVKSGGGLFFIAGASLLLYHHFTKTDMLFRPLDGKKARKG